MNELKFYDDSIPLLRGVHIPEASFPGFGEDKCIPFYRIPATIEVSPNHWASLSDKDFQSLKEMCKKELADKIEVELKQHKEVIELLQKTLNETTKVLDNKVKQYQELENSSNNLKFQFSGLNNFVKKIRDLVGADNLEGLDGIADIIRFKLEKLEMTEEGLKNRDTFWKRGIYFLINKDISDLPDNASVLEQLKADLETLRKDVESEESDTLEQIKLQDNFWKAEIYKCLGIAMTGVLPDNTTVLNFLKGFIESYRKADIPPFLPILPTVSGVVTGSAYWPHMPPDSSKNNW